MMISMIMLMIMVLMILIMRLTPVDTHLKRRVMKNDPLGPVPGHPGWYDGVLVQGPVAAIVSQCCSMHRSLCTKSEMRS